MEVKLANKGTKGAWKGIRDKGKTRKVRLGAAEWHGLPTALIPFSPAHFSPWHSSMHDRAETGAYVAQVC